MENKWQYLSTKTPGKTAEEGIQEWHLLMAPRIAVHFHVVFQDTQIRKRSLKQGTATNS